MKFQSLFSLKNKQIRRQFACNVKAYFLGKIRKIFFKKLSAVKNTQHAKH